MKICQKHNAIFGSVYCSCDMVEPAKEVPAEAVTKPIEYLYGYYSAESIVVTGDHPLFFYNEETQAMHLATAFFKIPPFSDWREHYMWKDAFYVGKKKL